MNIDFSPLTDQTLKSGAAAKAKAAGGTSVKEIVSAPGVIMVGAVFLYLSMMGFAYTAGRIFLFFWRLGPNHLKITLCV